MVINNLGIIRAHTWFPLLVSTSSTTVFKPGFKILESVKQHYDVSILYQCLRYRVTRHSFVEMHIHSDGQ